MKKFFGLFLLSVFSFLSFDAGAQSYYISKQMKPILKGDSVLLLLSWETPAIPLKKMEVEGLFASDQDDYKNNNHAAFYLYPKATRIIDVKLTRQSGSVDRPFERSKNMRKFFTIVVLDENGNEIRDEYSDVMNGPVDFKKLDITGMTKDEIRKAYDLTHKEIAIPKATVENSASEQKSQNDKGNTKNK